MLSREDSQKLIEKFNLDEFKIELNKAKDKAKGDVLPPVSDKDILANTDIQEIFALCQHGPAPTFDSFQTHGDILEELKAIKMNPVTKDYIDAANSAQRITDNTDEIVSEFITDISAEDEPEKEQEKSAKKKTSSWFGSVNSWFGSSSKQTPTTPVKSDINDDDDFGFEDLSQNSNPKNK